MAIDGISGLTGISGVGRTLASSGAGGTQSATSIPESAGRFFNELVAKTNELQHEADRSVEAFVTGQSRGLHEVMLAMEKSSVTFQFLSTVRNKAVDAYNEIMRMQV